MDGEGEVPLALDADEDQDGRDVMPDDGEDHPMPGLWAFIVCRRCRVRSPDEAERHVADHAWREAHRLAHATVGDPDAHSYLVYVKADASDEELRLPVTLGGHLAPRQASLSTWGVAS